MDIALKTQAREFNNSLNYTIPFYYFNFFIVQQKNGRKKTWKTQEDKPQDSQQINKHTCTLLKSTWSLNRLWNKHNITDAPLNLYALNFVSILALCVGLCVCKCQKCSNNRKQNHYFTLKWQYIFFLHPFFSVLDRVFLLS